MVLSFGAFLDNVNYHSSLNPPKIYKQKFLEISDCQKHRCHTDNFLNLIFIKGENFYRLFTYHKFGFCIETLVEQHNLEAVGSDFCSAIPHSTYLFPTNSSCRRHPTYSNFHTQVQKSLKQSVMPEGFIGVFPSSINERRDARDRKNDKPQQRPPLKKAFNRIVSYLKPQGLNSIKEDLTKGSDVSRTSNQLASLPAELLFLIISHLDVVNLVCLQITCQFFRAFISVDRVTLEQDRCRKWAITCFLEKDMDKYPAKIACAFCKTVRPTNRFRDFNH